MNKARLQELCQKRRWDLPEYTNSPVGTGGVPRFTASVTVNGSVFVSPDDNSGSVKEAQNKAAGVAFEALSANPAANAVPSPAPSPAVPSLSPQQSQIGLLTEQTGTTYKTRLQELCHKRRWDLPQYTQSLVESVCEPRFVASVTVNGAVFKSPDTASRSIKEAQNKAAAVAFETLSATPTADAAPLMPSSPAVESTSARPSSQIAVERHATYKSQLQVYAQKRNKELPTYTTVAVGLPHAPQFKAAVIIDGLTFECPQHFRTVREAEHAAAEVALANLSQEEIPVENSQVGVSCKTRLQEYMQKRKQPLPVYTTVKDPDSPLPLFRSIIEVCGMTFKGVAKSKKQAETNAAKLALDHIEGRNQSPVSSSGSTSLFLNGRQNSCSSTMKSEPIASTVSPISIQTSDQVMPGNQTSVAQESRVEAAQESKLLKNLTSAAKASAIEDAQDSELTENQMSVTQESKLTENQTANQESKPLLANPINEPIVTTEDCNVDCAVQPTANFINSNGSVLYETKDSDNEGIKPSLLCNTIQVYPNCPGTALPYGAVPLPFSDNLWAAVSLEFPPDGALKV